MNRRKSLKLAGCFVATVAMAPSTFTQGIISSRSAELARAQGEIPFSLPTLPYAIDALEPHLDASAMKAHHDERHAACVVALNKAIGEVPYLYIDWMEKGYFREKSGETIVRQLNSMPERLNFQNRDVAISADLRGRIRQEAGGHYNHSLFWQMMKKDGGGEPRGDLAAAVKKGFGSFPAFQKKFTQAALAHNGDGWAWLTWDAGALKIETLPGEDWDGRSCSASTSGNMPTARNTQNERITSPRGSTS